VRGALEGGSEVIEAEASIGIWVTDICGDRQKGGEKRKKRRTVTLVRRC
jgi:hypothetical protein